VIYCSDAIGCSNKICYRQTGYCAFRSGYADNSSIYGYINNDIVQFGSLQANISFGDIQTETGNFEQGLVDGILGMSWATPGMTCSPNCLSPVFDRIVSSNGIANIFGIYLTDTGGVLTLGGYDTTLYDGNLTWSPLKYPADYYQLSLSSVLIGSHSMDVSRTQYGTVILDGGTSLIIFPFKVYEEFVRVFQKYFCTSAIPDSQQEICGPGDENIFSGKYCILAQGYNISTFPLLRFKVEDAELAVPPENYFVLYRDENQTQYYCLGVAPGPVNLPFTILGDVFMRAFYIVIDRENKRVGFVGHTKERLASWVFILLVTLGVVVGYFLVVIFIIILKNRHLAIYRTRIP